MKNNLKIVITESQSLSDKSYVKSFESYGMDVILCERDGRCVVKNIECYEPDIVLADVFMPNLDILGVIKEVKKLKLEKMPMLMAMSELDNSKLEKDMFDNGVSYYFIRPFDTNVVADRINQLVKPKNNNALNTKYNSAFNDSDIELAITEMIHEIGMPAHIRGYQYVRDAILLCIKDRSVINSITKLLYPKVANMHGTTISRVERAIRTAIETAWNRGDINILNYYFGYTIQNERGKPTNSEFIAMLSDKLRLKLKIK